MAMIRAPDDHGNLTPKKADESVFATIAECMASSESRRENNHKKKHREHHHVVCDCEEDKSEEEKEEDLPSVPHTKQITLLGHAVRAPRQWSWPESL